MVQTQGKIIADFETSLAVKMAIGATTCTLQSATDSDGVALPTGRYFFTIDRNNSSKEHISCTLTGTALTNIKTCSRQGVETTGTLREHRVGSNVIISDFAHIKKINDLLNGTTNFDSATPLGYDGSPSITTGNQLATKTYVDTSIATSDAQNVKLTGNQTVAGIKTFSSSPIVPTPTNSTDAVTKAYADGLAIAGAPNASTTVKGIVEEATQAEFDASTDTGTTEARLFAVPSVVQTGITAKTFVAGEAITSKDAVFVARGNECRLISATSSTRTTNEIFGTTTWLYQSFTTSANTTSINRIKLWVGSSGNFPVNNGTVRLRATASGADIVSTTFGFGSQNSNTEVILDIADTTVSPSTTYFLVVSVPFDSFTTYFLQGGTTSSYSGGVSGISTNSGSTWTTPSTTVTGDFYFEVLEGDYTAGRVYKTIASTTSNRGLGFTANFIGFANASASAAANVVIKMIGMVTGLSGLTVGATYFLSNTAGLLSLTAGTQSKKVGISLSATDLLIKHDN